MFFFKISNMEKNGLTIFRLWKIHFLNCFSSQMEKNELKTVSFLFLVLLKIKAQFLFYIHIYIEYLPNQKPLLDYL